MPSSARFDAIKLPARTAVWLAAHLLPSGPRDGFGDDQLDAFDSFYRSRCASGGREVDYDLPYPKRDFLAYVAAERPVVLHGSNDPAIDALEPREGTDWRGDDTTAVFGTRDPLLAIFFAILDRAAYAGPIRNGGFLVETPTGAVSRRYYFSLALERLETYPFTGGTVYLLPADAFEPATFEYVGFDEWYCDRSVAPLASIAVDPQDFPVRDFVVGHREGESMLASVLRYRWRRRRTDPRLLDRSAR